MADSRKSRLGSALASARGALSMVEAAVEDTVAAVVLFHLTDAEGPPADPFAARIGAMDSVGHGGVELRHPGREHLLGPEQLTQPRWLCRHRVVSLRA